MGDILGHLLEGIGHVLVEVANWLPVHSIDEGWAWPIGFCLVVTLIALGLALYLAHAWLYQLAMGAAVAAFGFVCLGAWCSRSPRGG